MIALEVFRGARSVGRIWWEKGRVTLRLTETEDRTAFLRHLGGPLSRQDSAEVRFQPEGLTSEGFEKGCATAASERGLILAPRTSS